MGGRYSAGMRTILPTLFLAVSYSALLPVFAQEPSAPPTAIPAQATYESLQVVPAAQLLPANMLRGAGYVVDERVGTDGYLGRFLLRTDYGVFECHGREMLAIRIDEVRALDELSTINKGQAFLQAAGNAVAKPLTAAAGIARDPVGSVAKVPQGLAGLFKRAGDGLQSAGKAMSNEANKAHQVMNGENPDQAANPPSREDPFGYNINRNRWADEVGADPYTSNTVLAAKLSEVAAVTYTTELVAGLGVGAVAAPLSMVGNVDKFVLTEPPVKIRERIAAELAQLQCAPAAIQTMLANPAISPTQMRRLSSAMMALGPIAGLDVALQLAAVVESEVQVRFLCASLESLAARKAASGGYKSLVAIAPVPAAIRADDSLLVCAPVDVLPWIESTENFAARAAAYSNKALVLDGQITVSAKAGLEKLGWTISR